MRDGRPFTRPTRWSAGLDSFEPGKLSTWKLFAGAANPMGLPVSVVVANMGYVMPKWINVVATFSIDGVTFPVQRPGQVFIDDDPAWPLGQPSCVIHFPPIAENETFRGVHTLLLRTIVGDRVTR